MLHEEIANCVCHTHPLIASGDYSSPSSPVPGGLGHHVLIIDNSWLFHSQLAAFVTMAFNIWTLAHPRAVPSGNCWS